MLVLFANLAATLFMTGLIWFVQLVHYPLFAAVGGEEFAGYHEVHSRLTTRVVAPVMAVELVTAVLLVIDRPVGVGVLAVWAGVALVAIVWGSTAFVQVPGHQALGNGFAAPVHRRLVSLNWFRTAAWTARSGVVLGMVAVA